MTDPGSVHPAYATAYRCSCGAGFRKLTHETSGKLAPITVRRFPDGNVVVDPAAGTYRIKRKGDPMPPEGLPKNHWADCETWRRPR